MDSSQTLRRFHGTSGAPGMAIGPASVWKKQGIIITRHQDADPEQEGIRVEEAVRLARVDIENIASSLHADGHDAEAAVFQAHLMLLEDKTLHKKVREALGQHWNAEAAWCDCIEAFALRLEKLPDPTLSLRAADLRDVGERVTRILCGRPAEAGLALTEPSIIIAADLAPSETVSLDRSKVLGFCTAGGGPTSHTAILAKALGLPAIVSLGEEILSLNSGERLLVDGTTGEVIASPDVQSEQAFQDRLARLKLKAQAELAEADAQAVTLDGQVVEVVANVGSIADAANAIRTGAEGIGLLRTEFLFLDRKSSPDEDEQADAYRQILEVMDKRPVVIRTLDAGGDKELTYVNTGSEANPFLGLRAIRLCLSKPEMFKTQLRAMLRASPGHNLRIMFPMIATLQEVRQAKSLLAEAKEEVRTRGLPVAEDIQVGIMVEIPSTAIQADLFAREVDFFSVGTNDLTQYSMAADRTNPNVTYLSDHCAPTVIRQIRMATQAAHERGIWIGVCGEMAGDVDAIPILLGLGVDELSMSPALIPAAKSIVRRWGRAEAHELAEYVKDLDSASAVREYVRSRAR